MVSYVVNWLTSASLVMPDSLTARQSLCFCLCLLWTSNIKLPRHINIMIHWFTHCEVVRGRCRHQSSVESGPELKWQFESSTLTVLCSECCTHTALSWCNVLSEIVVTYLMIKKIRILIWSSKVAVAVCIRYAAIGGHRAIVVIGSLGVIVLFYWWNILCSCSLSLWLFDTTIVHYKPIPTWLWCDLQQIVVSGCRGIVVAIAQCCSAYYSEWTHVEIHSVNQIWSFGPSRSSYLGMDGLAITMSLCL